MSETTVPQAPRDWNEILGALLAAREDEAISWQCSCGTLVEAGVEEIMEVINHVPGFAGQCLACVSAGKVAA